jgi:hypothetical protein
LTNKLNIFIEKQNEIKINKQKLSDQDFGDVGSTKDQFFDYDDSNNNSRIIDKFDELIVKSG